MTKSEMKQQMVLTMSIPGQAFYTFHRVGKKAVAILDDAPTGPTCLCCVNPSHTWMMEQIVRDMGCNIILWSKSLGDSQESALLSRWPRNLHHRFVIDGIDETGHAIPSEEYLEKCREECRLSKL